MRELKIALDARLTPRSPGGVWQVVLGLAHGFSQLSDGCERYSFLVPAGYDGWLDRYLGENCEVIRARNSGIARSSIRKIVTRSRLFQTTVPRSDGTLERCGFDGVHFVLPIGFRTRLPSVYQIHDLQHLHFPEYFRSTTREFRGVVFPELCRQARRVFTMTDWGKQDAVEKLGLPEDKVAVVPWGSVLGAYDQPKCDALERVRNNFGLHEPFAYFPAKAYPHKNHIRLLQAVALARDELDLRIPLVLSGAEGTATPEIHHEIARLQLDGQVRHFGYVEADMVASLFWLCRCLVFPSYFEGWGLPITEALSLSKPIVCANATCLPEVAKDAAAYFEPHDTRSLTRQLARVWTDSKYRAGLQSRAKSVATNLNWGNTARLFREHYRTLFGKAQKAADAA